MPPQAYQNIHPLHTAQMGPPPLISAHFNQALQVALPLLSGLPEAQAFGILFMLNPPGGSFLLSHPVITNRSWRFFYSVPL